MKTRKEIKQEILEQNGSICGRCEQPVTIETSTLLHQNKSVMGNYVYCKRCIKERFGSGSKLRGI